MDQMLKANGNIMTLLSVKLLPLGKTVYIMCAVYYVYIVSTVFTLCVLCIMCTLCNLCRLCIHLVLVCII